MKKIVRPYKECRPWHLTQGYHDKHKAVDYHYNYGTFLVAPETCRVYKIITDKNFNEDLEPLSRGYGIVLKSLNREYFHWHCLGVFPVNEGDLVKQGQIIAQMGNSGFVMKGGKVVPIEGRLKPPYPGTHTHFAMKIDGQTVNPLEHIDWYLPVDYTWLDKIMAMIKILRKMTALLKSSKGRN